MQITLASPGPGNLLYMPIDLAKKLERIRLKGCHCKYAILVAAAGSPGHAGKEQRIFGARHARTCRAARVWHRCFDRTNFTGAAYSLLVRSDLKGKIRKIADLKGHVIGVHGHTKGGAPPRKCSPNIC